jgi:hypothetical protein
MAEVVEGDSTAAEGVLAAGECTAVAAACASGAAPVAKDSAVEATLSPGLAQAGTGMDLDARAEARRADPATAEAGLSKGGAVRRLVWADERGLVHHTRHWPMVTGTRLPVSAERALRWLAMTAFAAIGAVSEDGVSAALVGAAVGAIPASVGDSVLAGDGASAGVLSGIGRLIRITRGGAGTDIMASLTRMGILTSLTFRASWEETIGCSGKIVW